MIVGLTLHVPCALLHTKVMLVSCQAQTLTFAQGCNLAQQFRVVRTSPRPRIWQWIFTTYLAVAGNIQQILFHQCMQCLTVYPPKILQPCAGPGYKVLNSYCQCHGDWQWNCVHYRGGRTCILCHLCTALAPGLSFCLFGT